MSSALPPPRLSRATATYLLIAVSAVVFAYELALGREAGALVEHWGMIGRRLTERGALPPPLALLTLFSATFLHVGAVHLLANMVYLWIFGQWVEPLLGSGRFLALYLLGGAAAAATLLAVTGGSAAVAIGSSGAVAAVLGAYLALHPYLVVVPLAPRAVRSVWDAVPVMLLLLWLAGQLLASLGVLTSGTMGMTGGALWAHLGGFAAGLLLGPLLRGWQRRLFGA